MNENIPELKMLDKELNVSYVDDFTKLREHISNLRIIAIGLSNEVQGKNKQLQAYKDKEDKIIDYIKFNFCNDNDLNDCWHNDFNKLLQILNEGSDK